MDNRIVRWLVTATAWGLGIYLYDQLADDVVGGFFFGFVALIMLFRMALHGIPASEALVSSTDFSDKLGFDNGILSYKDRKQEWREPIEQFEGIMWRIEKSPNHRHKRHDEHVLELVHATKPERTVPLYRSQSEFSIRSRWVAASRTYQLPALRELDDGRIIRRMPGDLDKSVRDLVRAGKTDGAFDLGDEVPNGISWRHKGDRLTVWVRKARWPFLLGLVPVLFLAIVLPNDPPEAKMLILGVPSTLVLFWMLLAYRIEVSAQGVTVKRILWSIALPGRHLPLEQIMDVLQVGQFTSGVQLETNDRSIKLGPLANDNAVWLQSFLISALAHAPLGKS